MLKQSYHDGSFSLKRPNPRAILVGINLSHVSDFAFDASLEELERLLDTLGAEIVDRVTQRRDAPDAAYYIGRGKAEEIAALVKEKQATLVVFDSDLSQGQQKNLENLCGCPILDRTEVILDIFAKHARTKEAKMQVELACLEYLMSHLTHRWSHLERQKGGIGLRGLGEKQIELDRRQIRSRISHLKESLSKVAAEREVQRGHRKQFLEVAIVGYTNAGKSTIMNQLTDSSVYVDDRLFATLDPTVRLIDPKTRPPILLSDTVGFIKSLPHSLVASFRSTLQEINEADLLLHVADLSSPNYHDEIETTFNVIREMGVSSTPMIHVFNKMDKVNEVWLRKALSERYPNSVFISAWRRADIARLKEAIYDHFEKQMMELDCFVPYGESALLAKIYSVSKVIEREYLESGVRFKLRILKADASWLQLINTPQEATT